MSHIRIWLRRPSTSSHERSHPVLVSRFYCFRILRQKESYDRKRIVAIPILNCDMKRRTSQTVPFRNHPRTKLHKRSHDINRGTAQT
mmetsp:Transcript_4217/g.7393  ORF Transcript_4217/g.7393 Transcript_4217/m.7393 type:complete len:87 (-) Transcript_4217:353-613(-)